MAEQGAILRVMVYIDGYNLYHGMMAAHLNQYKWLDLQALSESFLRPEEELVAVKYFTAITKIAIESRLRQEIYLRALKAHCDKLKLFKGRFQAKERFCPYCDSKYVGFEEKKTDVNIACEILNDSHFNRYDRCYLVSGDSDLAPALKIVKNIHPDKQAIVAFPPRRKSKELRKIAYDCLPIYKQTIKSKQLPAVVTLRDNELIQQPKEWQ